MQVPTITTSAAICSGIGGIVAVDVDSRRETFLDRYILYLFCRFTLLETRLFGLFQNQRSYGYA